MSDTQNVARVVLAVGCENEKTIYLSISSYKSWLSLSGILKFHDTHQSRGCRQGKKITCLCWYTNVRWYAGQLHCLEFYSCTSLKHTRTASIETTANLKIQNIPSKPNFSPQQPNVTWPVSPWCIIHVLIRDCSLHHLRRCSSYSYNKQRKRQSLSENELFNRVDSILTKR